MCPRSLLATAVLALAWGCGCSQDSRNDAATSHSSSSAPAAPDSSPPPAPPPPPAPSAPPAPSILPVHCSQAIVVSTPSWQGFAGSLQRWERQGSEPWRKIGEPFDVAIGRRGMAWGRGLHPEGLPGPVKREGDHRSPAGVFELASAYGYADGPPEGARWPYRRLTEGWKCIDHPRHAQYNTMALPEAPFAVAPTTAWDGVRRDIVFERFVFVNHNVAATVRGAGSCVLLHPWMSASTPTQGCTGMAPSSLVALLQWMDPQRHPLLVQLPGEVLGERASEWGLPH